MRVVRKTQIRTVSWGGGIHSMKGDGTVSV